MEKVFDRLLELILKHLPEKERKKFCIDLLKVLGK